jgi:oligopeptide/dipeptide ABC transporter ATP-binding protein
MAKVLEVRDLRLYYKTLRGVVRAVDGVSFTIDEGEALGLVGESGCGKTSVGISILRLLPKNVHTLDGAIMLNGTDLLKLDEEEVRRQVRWRQVSMVFQGAMNALNPVIRVGHQVAEPLLLLAGQDKVVARRRVEELFERIGLPREVYDRYPHELSGGMKQRVVIAMALVLNPSLVILDEPTSALDVSVQAQIMNLLKRLKRELDISMIFVTHDITLASDLCDRMAVMYAGHLMEIGSAEEVLLKPKHPYTQKLLAATPRLRGESNPEFIPGAPPDLVAPPSGCRFHPRCHRVFEDCSRLVPPDVEVAPGHLVKCLLYLEGDSDG